MSFSRHGIRHDWTDTVSGVYVNVSPGSAETLVRKGGITNRHLIAYSLSNISAKNYQNWLMCVEVILCNISVDFLRHSVVWKCISFIIYCSFFIPVRSRLMPINSPTTQLVHETVPSFNATRRFKDDFLITNRPYCTLLFLLLYLMEYCFNGRIRRDANSTVARPIRPRF